MLSLNQVLGNLVLGAGIQGARLIELFVLKELLKHKQDLLDRGYLLLKVDHLLLVKLNDVLLAV